MLNVRDFAEQRTHNGSKVKIIIEYQWFTTFKSTKILLKFVKNRQKCPF